MPGDLDGITVVTMPAEIDLASAAHVRAALMQALDGARVLIADMAATTRCTLEGVQALLHASASEAPSSAHPAYPRNTTARANTRGHGGA